MITDGCEDCEIYQKEVDTLKEKVSELEDRVQELESFTDETVTKGRRLL